MARTEQHAADSQPPTSSVDSPRKLPGDSDVETLGPPGFPAGGALFRALLAAGVDPAAAYTAVREMESMAGQSVVTQLGAQIQAGQSVVTQLGAQIQAGQSDLAQLGAQIQSFASEVRNDLQEIKSRLSGVESGLAEVRSDMAVLKKEVRLIWGALSLLVVTLTAILIRLFAN